jgi:hypothetical protein
MSADKNDLDALWAHEPAVVDLLRAVEEVLESLEESRADWAEPGYDEELLEEALGKMRSGPSQ